MRNFQPFSGPPSTFFHLQGDTKKEVCDMGCSAVAIGHDVFPENENIRHIPNKKKGRGTIQKYIRFRFSRVSVVCVCVCACMRV